MQDALQSAAPKWYTLGLELGVDGTLLHQIELETGQKPSYYLNEMLKLWVEREDPRPSWRALIEALKKKDEMELANRLQEQYGEWCHSLAHELHKLHTAHTERLISWHAGGCEEEGKEKNEEEGVKKNKEEGKEKEEEGKEKKEEEGKEKNKEEEGKEKNKEEEVKEKNEEEGGGEREVPDHKTQKQELHAVLQQRLRKGDTWYECVHAHVPRHSGQLPPPFTLLHLLSSPLLSSPLLSSPLLSSPLLSSPLLSSPLLSSPLLSSPPLSLPPQVSN